MAGKKERIIKVYKQMIKFVIKYLFIIKLFTWNTISCQNIKNNSIGQISIFEEPSNSELKQWRNYDLFMIETYRYVLNEKKILEGRDNNPFEDSLFVKNFSHITYRKIYESAKAFKDSLYFKSPDKDKFKNINEWALETFSEFMEFNKAFNDFIKLNNPKTNRN